MMKMGKPIGLPTFYDIEFDNYFLLSITIMLGT
jgi:hypothetical protein